MKEEIWKRILMILVIATLNVFLLPQFTTIFEEKPLKGTFYPKPDIHISTDNWFSGNYALIKESYLVENFGFRNSIIRITNQIKFSAFNQTTAQDVVIGKSGYLYEQKYINAINGADFVGEKKILETVTIFKNLQTKLKSLNKHLLIALAPSKAQYFQEYLPSEINTNAITNYKVYKKFLIANNINFIDINQLFLNLKQKKIQYPLYPQTGTHWSIYSMHLALDSINAKIGKLINKKLLPFSYPVKNWSDSLRTPDGDMAEALNLIFEPKHYPMPYPEIVCPQMDSGYYKPNVLTVSDSYWMGIYFTHLPQLTYNNHQFWYYNKKVFSYGDQYDNTDVESHLLNKEILKYDIIMIMASEAQLDKIGWEFPNRLLIALNEVKIDATENSANIMPITQIEINHKKNQIKNNKEWYKLIITKAVELKISTDSMLVLDAIYMIKEERKKIK